MKAVVFQKNIGSFFLTAACMLLTGMLFFCGDAARNGVKNGLILCADVLIPSLFPFLALSSFFCESGASAWMAGKLGRVFHLLFGDFGGYGDVVLVSVLGGYPAGAAAVRALQQRGELDRDTARMLMLFCVNVSPAFAVTAVGRGMLGSARVGWLLYSSCILSSVLGGVLVSRVIAPLAGLRPAVRCPARRECRKPITDAFVDGTASASRALFCVCSTVTLFTAFLELLDVFLQNENIALFFNGIIEVTTACGRFTAVGGSAATLAGLMAFGGVCTGMQVLSLGGESMPRPWFFWLSRGVHGFLAWGIAEILLRLFPSVRPAAMVMSNQTVLSLSATPLGSGLVLLSALVLIASLGLQGKKNALSGRVRI